MKSRLSLLLTALLLVSGISSFAQEMNFIKTNIFSDLSGNYSLQYERILEERYSASLALNVMPKKGIPFAGLISDAIIMNPDIDMDIKDFKYSSWSVTPDFRFYLGEGYGKGFYIAPYLKYSQFRVHDFVVKYTNDENKVNDITLSGKFTTTSGGVLFGAQWPIGDYICLDWWILGFHGGQGKATITGDPSIDLTPAEQSDFESEFEDIDIPMLRTDLSVSADKVTLTNKSPWFGVRSGLAIGIRF